jgi:hypothetical protein
MSEFYVMDVILNRSPFPNLAEEVDEEKAGGRAMRGGDDRVVMVKSYFPGDVDDVNDYKFRTMILFLPQCGVFYCARERRSADVGVLKSLVALDMSWLRLTQQTNGHGEVSYTFGDGGYVKRFHSGGVYHPSGHSHDEVDGISAWRVLLDRTNDPGQNRVSFRVVQSLDCDGPVMAPDVYAGQYTVAWPHADLAEEYNGRLARANSARKDGRHYAPGCHHSRLPDTCWIIDPTLDPFIDIIVDLPQVGQCKHRQSIIMVRNVFFVDGSGDDDLAGAISCITECNKSLRSGSSHGRVRAKSGDVGTMHAIGTHVELDGVTTVPYKANEIVGEDLLRSTVVSLARIGRCCFPQVYSVIRDTEGDSGLPPVVPMDGEGGWRVGYTIDMSVDLGNASHYDIHDASQGYSVWTEEFPGRGTNWYFVMPNLHGMRDGVAFSGLAVRLTHGVAISWDGRVIRHCTSLSQPDGPAVDMVGGVSGGVKNHLYGTFTSAKERVVEAGRTLCAAGALANRLTPPVIGSVCHSDESGTPSKTGKRRRKRRRKRR